MKITILSGNPKKEGLCQSVIEAAKQGASEGRAEVFEIRLCDLDIGSCHICGEGWGQCRSEHTCAYGADGFDAVKDKLMESDAVILVTPVYWSETSEALKSFIDRFRRCANDRFYKDENGKSGALADKQVLLIASAGGSGNGILTCLEQMDRFCRHTGAAIFDYIGINRWNSDYKKEAAKAAAQAIASGRRNGETL